jgi:hypothetical protein
VLSRKATRDNARRKPLPGLRIIRDLFRHEKTIREFTPLVVLFRKRKSVHRKQPSYGNFSRDVFGVKDHPTWGYEFRVRSGGRKAISCISNFRNRATFRWLIFATRKSSAPVSDALSLHADALLGD